MTKEELYSLIRQHPNNYSRMLSTSKLDKLNKTHVYINTLAGTTFAEKCYRYIFNDIGICKYCGELTKFGKSFLQVIIYFVVINVIASIIWLKRGKKRK